MNEAMVVQRNGSNGPRVNGDEVGLAKREEFGAVERVRSGETAATTAAAHAEAMVKARYSLAMMRPRNLDEVRLAILEECKRPRFAEVARFSVPRGGKAIEGWSIRAAETFARRMGNIDVTKRVVFDDARQRILAVTVLDLEANMGETVEVTVSKTVERRKLGKGQTALGVRHNSFGDEVYIVEATDEEMLVKVNALLSKAKRNAILGLVPGDLLEEALDQVRATLQREDAEDPAAARKRLVDFFASVGVTPSMLVEYVGHDLAVLAKKELADLRAIAAALKGGEATWDEVVREKRGAAPAAEAAGSATGPAKTVAAVRGAA